MPEKDFAVENFPIVKQIEDSDLPKKEKILGLIKKVWEDAREENSDQQSVEGFD